VTYQPPCDRPISAGQLRSGPAVWLLTIEVAGRTLRYSSRPVRIGDRVYRGGLPTVEVDQSLDMLQQDAQAPSASVGLIMDDALARWVSYGHRLDRSVAELAWYVEGTTWEERQVIVAGPMLAGAYGAPGEPMTAVIEPQTQGDGAAIGTVTTYGPGSVPDAFLVEDTIGEPYPLVFGRPHTLRRIGGFSRVTYASKAIRWRRSSSDPELITDIMICQGHVPDGESVRVTWRDAPDPADEGSTTYSREQFSLTYDDQGVPVTVISVGALTVDQRKSRSWYVRWNDSTGGITSTPGGVDYIVRTYTDADEPVNETLTTISGGDVLTRATWETVATWGAASSAALTIDRATPITVLSLSTADLTTGGTYTGTTGVRAAGPVPLRFALTAASATAPAEGVLRVGIRRSPPPSAAIRTLGELALYLAERSRQRIDRAAWVSAVPWLAVPVGGTLQADNLAWETLLNDVLPLTPISLRAGSQGIAPVVWRWWASLDDAEARMTVGRDGVTRLPDIRSARPDSEVSNEALVRYGWDVIAGNYMLNLRLNGRNDPTRAGGRWTHGTATMDSTISRATYGRGRLLRLDSRYVYETATAAWWARWRLAAEGWAHRIVELEAPQHYGHLMPGDVVSLTDEAAFIDTSLAFVTGRRLTDVGRVGLSLVLIDGVQGRRTTGSGDSGTPWTTGGTTPQ